MTLQRARFFAYNEPDFRARIEHLIVKAAVSITTEGDAVPLHAERLVLAQAILHSSESYVSRFALAALTNPALLSQETHEKILDSDLEFTINSVFDSFTSGDPGVALASVSVEEAIPAQPTSLLSRLFSRGG